MTHIGLIRHGLTAWNSKKRIQGQADIQLSSKGREMVACWGETLRPYQWDIIITSPLERARETGRILQQTLEIPFFTIQGLQEQNWGMWTGQTLRQLKHTQLIELNQAVSRGWQFQPPEGESRQEVLKRARKALLQAAALHQGKHMLVVSHQGVLKCILYHLLGRQFLPTEPAIIRPYSLHILKASPQTLFLDRLNALGLEQ
ncbi:histidine phosphatase family protein [Desulfogranum japonicum]|uniref:histidine phosphatase family protein n=1 Tax=Desulfogranum japonicum TaxID=231447 RepID=UPI0004167BA4|nr:histidine phosphatase family protein [Desulfogranum japonicum]